MKNGILIAFCLIQFIFCAHGQTDTNDTPGTIYFYRQNNYTASAIKMKILMNEKPLIYLKNGSMFKQEVAPGNTPSPVKCRN